MDCDWCVDLDLDWEWHLFSSSSSLYSQHCFLLIFNISYSLQEDREVVKKKKKNMMMMMMKMMMMIMIMMMITKKTVFHKCILQYTIYREILFYFYTYCVNFLFLFFICRVYISRVRYHYFNSIPVKFFEKRRWGK